LNAKFLRKVLLKGLLLFLAADLAFTAINPGWLGKLSLYNSIFPGRERFPFGEDAAQAYNLSLFNLEAMFAAHVIADGKKPADEFRVIVIGDSSTWGTLLRPEETMAGQLNTAALKQSCGKKVRVYNLGYPTISLTKDLVILDHAMRYQPDMIIWPVTLEAFPKDKQLSSPIVANNAARVDELISKYALALDPKDPDLVRAGFFDRTIFGQRRALADLFRLQMYGVLWAATGIDQVYPEDYTPAQTDFENDTSFHGMQENTFDENTLAFGILDAGMRAAGNTPVLLINEPILISKGQNSDIRYNFFYPKWAYNKYRFLMDEKAQQNGWNYLDMWADILPDQFTNSAIHLTPAGEALMASTVENLIQMQGCP
jgi:hypothetical protein